MGNTIGTAPAANYSAFVDDVDTANAETVAGTYTIDVSGTIDLGGQVPEIKLASGVDLDIVGGNNATLEGAGAGTPDGGLFVYSGDVDISNLTIQEAYSVGGTGTNGGGGGAGLGGGLFVGAHASVTLDNVAFHRDGASGGSGANSRSTYHGRYHSTAGVGGEGSRPGLGHGGGGSTTPDFGGGGKGGDPGAPAPYYSRVAVTTPPASASIQRHLSQGGPGQPGTAGGFGGGAGGQGEQGTPVTHVTYRYHSTYTTTNGAKTGYASTLRTSHPTGSDNGGVGGGGGGLGAGGDIFVQGGGKLKILGGVLDHGSVHGGGGGQGDNNGASGESLGDGIFLQGAETLILAPGVAETLDVQGSIADEAGNGGPVADAGGVVVDGAGMVQFDVANSFAGGLTLEEGTLVLGAPVAAGGGGITFDAGGADPTLMFSQANAPTEPITGFGPGDEIEITSFVETGHTFNGSVLTITSADGDVNLTWPGFDPSTIQITTDGTDTYITPLCFLRGTRVLTPTGEAMVEDVRIGDRLVTVFGGQREVRWIGRQSYDARFVRNNPAKRPVRILAGALGEGRPARDLRLSAGHSILLGGRLVLARSLVNGITVIDEAEPDEAWLDYFSIEFETHDCLVAEGVFAESFADGAGLRDQFHNVREFNARYPGFESPDAPQLCRSRPQRGWPLEEALRPVVARAQQAVTPGPLAGVIDVIETGAIEGWAQDLSNPFLPVLLAVMLADEVIGTVLACDPRDDLRNAGIGNGQCAFSLTPPGYLSTEALATLRIRRASDGAELPRAEGAAQAAA